MIYLHEKPVSDILIRHWANESESAMDEEATYKIRQVETGIVYAEAVDIIPCRYTYEATDEPIDEAESVGDAE